MERLTTNDTKKVCYDPWELCGMDKYCKKSAHEEGGCAKGCHIVKKYVKLAEYEDAEENGLLFRMRFKVGDVVWIKGDEFPAEVLAVSIDGQGLFYEYGGMSDIGNFGEEDIGKIVFLTREEAEKVFAEMGQSKV